MRKIELAVCLKKITKNSRTTKARHERIPKNNKKLIGLSIYDVWYKRDGWAVKVMWCRIWKK